MAYQEVTRTSYGKRVGNSFKGIGSGIVMIILGACLLWWNEGRAVKTSKMLKETEHVTMHVDDVSSLDPSLSGKVIHASALAKTDDYLTDSEFGVGASAIKLERRVEYYQWKESTSTTTQDKVGGAQETTTTYNYSKGWTSSPINSNEFKDPEYKGLNKVLANYEDFSTVAENVTFGAYRLPKNMISAISGSVPVELSLDESKIEAINNRAKTALGLQTTGYFADRGQYVSVNKNVIYIGKDSANPEVGDVKITFTKVLPADVSIIAQVANDTFTSFTAKNGKTFSDLRMGVVSMDQMFEQQKSANKTMLWIFRILGILLICGGFKGIFGFLDTLTKVLPFLSKIVGAGTSLVSNVLGVALSFIIIALAWLAYRPLLAIVLLAAVAALIFFLMTKSKAKKAEEAPATPAE